MKFSEIYTSQTNKDTKLSAMANNIHGNKHYYLLGGVHGDEPEGVFVLQQLFTWLQTQDLDLSLIVVPILNPDGYLAKTRVNANGVDLNRNWPASNWSIDYNQDRYCPGPKPLSELENVFLANLFQQIKPHLILSFHSLRPLLDHNQFARADAEYLAKYNNYELVTDIGYPTPGSLGSYVDEVLQCGIITYELPVISNHITLDAIWKENKLALQNYFVNFACR